MTAIRVTLDGREMERILTRYPREAPKAISRGLNRAGAPTATRFKRAVRKALGLKDVRYGFTGERISFFKGSAGQKKASPGNLRFSQAGYGKPIPLKYFGARETRKGVSAAPMNRRSIFRGTFQKGGLFPDRKHLRRGEHVFKRVSAARKPIEIQYGPSVPEAFLEPGPSATWMGEASRRTPPEIVSQLARILSGKAPS
jgi:hypothetical protein